MANIRLKLSSIGKKSSDVIYSDIKMDSVAIDDTIVNKQSIRNSVKNILSWRRGERCLFPEFGNRIYDYVFENIDAGMINRIQNDINGMLSYEKRIKVTNIEVQASIDMQSVTIAVTYTIPILNDSDSITISVSR